MSTTVKYQIFVSSTYEDLKAERDQVVKAVLEMGHIPVGMEMFSAADEEQWSIIQRHIAASDYYVVIVAHRYGSMVGGVSYTEKEYDFAVEKGLPALGFIINDGAPWPGDRRDSGAEAELKRVKLAAFKEKVRRKPVHFWSTATELYGQVAISLMKTITAQPRGGWIPASQGASAEAATEFARLSKENAEFRAALQQVRDSTGVDARAADVVKALKAHKIDFDPRGQPLIDSPPPPADLLQVFQAALTLASGAILLTLTEALTPKFFTTLNSDALTAVQRAIPSWVREFVIQDLVSTGSQTRQSPVGGIKVIDRWELTEFGRAFLRFLRERG